MAAPPNWIFSTLAFIGFLMCMIPLPWHLEGKFILIKHHARSDLLSAWNTGTCLYMIWTGLACLNQFINSVVWNSDTINKAPVWCDICMCFRLFKNYSPSSSRPCSHPIHDRKLGRHPCSLPLYQPSPVPNCLCSISNEDACGEATRYHDRSSHRSRNSLSRVVSP